MNVLQNEMQDLNINDNAYDNVDNGDSSDNGENDENQYNDTSTCHDSNMVYNHSHSFKSTSSAVNGNIGNYGEKGVRRNEKQKYSDKNEVKEVLNCSYCNKHVYAVVKTYTPVFVYILVFLLFLFISFFTIFLLPLLYLTFKQKKYSCPYCEKNLISSEKLFKIKRENQILTFQFPKCAIIISAKYLVLFLSLIFLIFFFYIIRITNHFNFENLAKGPYIKASWIDYLDDCGNKSQFRNKFNSIHNFKMKYDGNTIIWKGTFFQIKEGFFNNNSLYIKMEPSEYKYDKPDIRAIFNDSLISQIENLQKNDFIEFECTLIQISKNREPHLCILWNVLLLEKYQQKNFNVVDFVKHLSILDMINNHSNANPFFINLKNKNGNIKRSIKIVHFSPGISNGGTISSIGIDSGDIDSGDIGSSGIGSSGISSSGISSSGIGSSGISSGGISSGGFTGQPKVLHGTDPYMFNFVNNEIINSGEIFPYIDDMNGNAKMTLSDIVLKTSGEGREVGGLTDEDEDDPEEDDDYATEDYELDDMHSMNRMYDNSDSHIDPFDYQGEGLYGRNEPSLHHFSFGDDDNNNVFEEEHANVYESDVHNERDSPSQFEVHGDKELPNKGTPNEHTPSEHATSNDHGEEVKPEKPRDEGSDKTGNEERNKKVDIQDNRDDKVKM
ncbi:conserved Plasmodium protein, unknown function [Plasmodium ovale wallikeri]|uniref:LITAF domain-containing protein n=1 Tax=Plasmodium ovale wallikeri TaxID=864142 RepID=A0A1A8YJS4_PLAOA|nr:conserved Plasmodium protein, unknown function [Plasmodium ovale wallikeri]SBT31793.1 conserved Plasmodium protein, unknown function [Plasmodium ovale wallikeri]